MGDGVGLGEGLGDGDGDGDGLGAGACGGGGTIITGAPPDGGGAPSSDPHAQSALARIRAIAVEPREELWRNVMIPINATRA